MTHASVLLQEAIDGLDIKKGDTFLDCTLGGGGHSASVCERFGKTVTIIGLDIDRDAIARSIKRLEGLGCTLAATESNFRHIGTALQSLGIKQVDRILFDLGLSSYQIEESGRGFSFQKNEPLLMSMKKDVDEGDLSAYEIVNSWDEEDIATILFTYGDERFSRRIARKIVEKREAKKIETTNDLVEVIKEATPFAYHRGRIHPATRTFQALRIATNDELSALKDGIQQGWEHLAGGGRMAIISFHSGEDRIVKHTFRELVQDGKAQKVTGKPITPGDKEMEENPRSRSAKLRIIEKI
jgi:16S rRNA (cytosine1402-N4)-methyltransferase